MVFNKNPQILLILLSTLLITTIVYSSPSSLTITKIDRVVQLNSAYPTQTIKIQYKCQQQPCGDTVYHSILSHQNQKIAYITFHKDKSASQNLQYTTQQHIQKQNNKYQLYKINIKKQLHQDQNYNLIVSIVYLNRYVNYPTSIDLTQDQKFQYKDNKRCFAIYDVAECSITYKFGKVLGFENDGEKKGISTVMFRNMDVKAFTYVEHNVHGVNNQPQVYFSEVVREIEVSHWGNIAITEFYKIKNIGPELKGQFSRVQFSSNNKFQSKNAWRGIQTQFPYQIWGLYYRDQVGNISTSRAYRDDSAAAVRAYFQPRFGLLGGWKSNWQIGYNLKTQGFLTHDGNKFQLNKIPLSYALSTIIAQKYIIKVILPQGSQNTKIRIGSRQLTNQQITNGVSFGYLDFAGRPTFTFDSIKGNFKDQKVKISYQFSQFSILKKPLLVFAAIFSILMMIIVVKRLNMSAFEQVHVKRI